ncbi:MAG: DUF1956 domain-containing protein [Acidobacteria bacterium CG_4_9_14_3_um_filter_49_7]|nr:MAG: DUF1956 domain-containing protein [Acidobacteria bacterium CG_4_9_14_3_um_filter_49_7]
MKEKCGKPVATRGRLLEAASRIFAEKGFRDTTIAEICSEAKANIAAVNYHFNDKETLYRESWRYAYRQSVKKYKFDETVHAKDSVQDWLRAFLKSIVVRILDPECVEFEIIAHEMSSPTGLLEEILEEEINPQRELIKQFIRTVLGPDVSEQTVRFCHISIMGQCFHLLMHKKASTKAVSKFECFRFDEMNAYLDHLVTFSLAGLSAISDRVGHN